MNLRMDSQCVKNESWKEKYGPLAGVEEYSERSEDFCFWISLIRHAGTEACWTVVRARGVLSRLSGGLCNTQNARYTPRYR